MQQPSSSLPSHLSDTPELLIPMGWQLKIIVHARGTERNHV